MASLLTHVYYVQNLLNKGKISDDTNFSSRMIAHSLKQARARLIKTKLDRKEYISDLNFQKICIPLVLHAFHDCDCVATPDECKFLKSEFSIPEPLIASWGSTFQVLYLNGKKIPMSSITSLDYAEYSLASSKRVSFILEERNIFILNSKKLAMVLGKALFNDPDQVNTYMKQVCSSYEQCAPYYSEEFPIDPDLVNAMYQLTLEILLKTQNLPQDNKNDGRSPEQVQATDPNEVERR